MSNQFGFIDIILLAMFAGFIILRLRNILGRKTGHQGKPINRYFLKVMEVLKDIERNEAIKKEKCWITTTLVWCFKTKKYLMILSMGTLHYTHYVVLLLIRPSFSVCAIYCKLGPVIMCFQGHHIVVLHTVLV